LNFSSRSFPFSALTLLAGRQEGHPPYKKLGVGLLMMTFCLELSTSYSQGAPGHGKSWNLGRPFSRPGKSWKIAKVMENDGNVMEFLLLH